MNVSQSLKEKLVILWKIYAWDSILKHCDGALLWGAIDSENLMKVKELLENLSYKITESMNLLTEASSASDKIVHSVVSKNDDKLYSKIFNAAAHSRLNREPVLSVISDTIKPLSQKLKMTAKI